MSKKRELELKATFQPEHLECLKNLPAIEKRAVGRTQSKPFATVYFDTPDHALRRQGLSLRVRKLGRAYIQCVKRADKRLAGMLIRTEWEGPVPNEKPAISVIDDKVLRRQIKRVSVEGLQPIFKTNFRRSSRGLRFDDGSTATLDIDVGEIIAGDKSEPICEFELELDSGGPEHLFGLASEIRASVPFRLSSTSKASRGYALVTNKYPQPVRHGKLGLPKYATVEDALATLVQHCLDHLQANEAAVLATDDAEGVHQMRVALRRLRAALRLFKSTLPEEQYGWAMAEAKWLTGELAPAREWDVFAEEFVAPVAQLSPGDRCFEPLVAAVDRARQQSRQRARDAVATERYTDFLLQLGAWLSARAWRNQPVSETTVHLLDPISDNIAKLLKEQDRAVRSRGQDIAKLSDMALHELRLAVKRLRYAVDFFESFYPKRGVKAYRKHLARLQDGLGYLSDVAAADSLLSKLASCDGEPSEPARTYAGGLTVGWHRHAAIGAKEKLVDDMAAFLRTEPFWRDG